MEANKMNETILLATMTAGTLAWVFGGYAISIHLTNTSKWLHKETTGWLEYYAGWAMLALAAPLLLALKAKAFTRYQVRRVKLAYLKEKWVMKKEGGWKHWWVRRTAFPQEEDSIFISCSLTTLELGFYWCLAWPMLIGYPIQAIRQLIERDYYKPSVSDMMVDYFALICWLAYIPIALTLLWLSWLIKVVTGK
jgi:hypothetical protein